MRTKQWAGLSIICFLLGIVVWLPNFIFHYGYPFWLLTFIINPIGIWLGYLGESRKAIVLNVTMTFSLFIVMLIGYVTVAILYR